VPIEPHVAIARVDESGEATLWDSSQSPFAQRDLIAETLGITQSKMRVIAPLVGGGFGGKAGVSMESLAVAIATRVKGYPVKLLLTRDEEFYTSARGWWLTSKWAATRTAFSGQWRIHSIGTVGLTQNMA
jgi:carbon-monoxide dehydrogenase large subunit